MTSAHAADCVECPELYSGKESGWGGLQDEFASADCADARAPNCANLILDNLDDWAAWYETNG